MKAQSKSSSASNKLNTNAGGAGPGRVRRSPARQAGQRAARIVWARTGMARQARRGSARYGMAGSGKAG